MKCTCAGYSGSHLESQLLRRQRVGKIKVQGQHRQKVSETRSSINTLVMVPGVCGIPSTQVV
jgi:hypothetical protein